ncbi:Transcriptional regulator [Desulfovibrionales bacterium]
MWKVIIFVAAGFLLFKLITNERRRAIKIKKDKNENLIATGEMTKDLMCGAFVSMDSDIRVNNDGKVFHFCSYDCRDKYLKQIGVHTVSPEESINI